MEQQGLGRGRSGGRSAGGGSGMGGVSESEEGFSSTCVHVIRGPGPDAGGADGGGRGREGKEVGEGEGGERGGGGGARWGRALQVEGSAPACTALA